MAEEDQIGLLKYFTGYTVISVNEAPGLIRFLQPLEALEVGYKNEGV